MREITVLYDGTAFTFKWIKALFWASNRLRDLGYKVSFPNLEWALPRHEKSNKDILKIVNSRNFDIVCLAFHHSTSEIGKSESETRINIMQQLRKRSNWIVWLDTADSTGTCMFDVLPFVDKYLKVTIQRLPMQLPSMLRTEHG